MTVPFSNPLDRPRRGTSPAPKALAVAALLSLGALWPSPSAASGPGLGPGDHELTLKFAGRDRRGLVHVPRAAAEGSPLPLVINLHGGGGNPEAQRSFTGMDELADREGFVVLYPAGHARRWAPQRRFLTWNAGVCCDPAKADASDDVRFIQSLLAEAARHIPIDPARVYVTGFSNGAMMAYALANAMPERIAAIAAVAGIALPASGSLPMPILHVHSIDDTRVPFAGGETAPVGRRRGGRVPPVAAALAQWARHNGCKPELEMTRTKRTWSTHSAELLQAPGCPADAPVVLWQLHGPGHVWPSAQRNMPEFMAGPRTDAVDANAEIWAFFKRFRRPGAPALDAAPAAAGSPEAPQRSEPR